MISRKLIEELAGKYQTIEINIAREYCQHLFLSNLYQMKKSERILFKGGTALRVMYQSPRFSEDLDFSCSGVKIKDIEDLLLRNVIEIEKSEIGVEILESKSTSGGYLGKLYFRFFDFEETIRIEGSFCVSWGQISTFYITDL
ncbi:nucleotidyl transferase AbiEii/AbiGii toxin family protein [candidate division WOR-3 bacterium]|nr:nucleotidyl transferase AbiEii/AbiGii toxin family protein [candidate division WOR-3 bacterium]